MGHFHHGHTAVPKHNISFAAVSSTFGHRYGLCREIVHTFHKTSPGLLMILPVFPVIASGSNIALPRAEIPFLCPLHPGLMGAQRLLRKSTSSICRNRSFTWVTKLLNSSRGGPETLPLCLTMPSQAIDQAIVPSAPGAWMVLPSQSQQQDSRSAYALSCWISDGVETNSKNRRACRRGLGMHQVVR